MYLGDKGKKVKNLQKQLIQRGLLDSYEDSYGIKTKRAVIEIQKMLNHRLTGEYVEPLLEMYDTGILGIETHGVPASTVTSGSTNSLSSSNKTATSSSSTSSVTASPVDISLEKGADMECYIKNLLTNTVIPLACVPEDISISNSAEFENQHPRGRSTPYLGYSGSGPRTLSFSVKLSADFYRGNWEKVIACIEALVYPAYGEIIKAPSCFVSIGKIKMKAVCASVDLNMSPPIKDGVYSIAEVSFSFTEEQYDALQASDVERGGI